MKKLTLLIGLLSASFLLTACSPTEKTGKQEAASTSQTSSSSEAKVSDQEQATMDAETLLGAILTKDDRGFSRLYGQSYDDWTEEKIFPSQIQKFITENEWLPEDKYTFDYIKDGDKLTPTDLLQKFLATRRDNFKDIGTYELKNLVVNEHVATVTVASRHMNGVASGNAVNNIYLALFDGNLDIFGAFNQADAADKEFKKVRLLISFFLFYANYSNLLVEAPELPARLNETPLTEGVYEVTFDLTKDKDNHWLIAEEDYKNLMSDLYNQTETADQVVYPDGTSD